MFEQAIEAALLQLPMVNGCCVVAHGEEGEDKYLAAYVVPEGKVNYENLFHKSDCFKLQVDISRSVKVPATHKCHILSPVNEHLSLAGSSMQ